MCPQYVAVRNTHVHVVPTKLFQFESKRSKIFSCRFYVHVGKHFVLELKVDGFERLVGSVRQDALASGRLEIMQTAHENLAQDTEPGVGRARCVPRHHARRPQHEDVALVGSG